MKRKQIVSSMVVLSLLTSSVPTGVYAQEGVAVNEGISSENEKVEEVKEEPKEEIKDEVKEEPTEEVKDEVKEEPKEEIKDEVKEEPKEEIKDEIKEEPTEEVKDEVKEEPQQVIFENPYEGILTDEEAAIIEKDQSELSLDEQAVYFEAEEKLNGGIALMSSTSAEQKFLISSGEQLNDLATKIQRSETYFNGTKSWAEANFELVGNISLSEYEDNWIGIGTASNPFKGTFDGNGYEISYFISNQYSLFNIAENATIKNFTVYGDLDVTVSNDGNTGGIVGKATNCIIENCISHVYIYNEQAGYTGGVVGYAENTQVTNCKTTDSVYADYNFAGGIIGYMVGGKAENCIADGINVEPEDYAGGIAAYAINGAEIKNCSLTGVCRIGADKYAGGIAGYIDNSVLIENCYSEGIIRAADMFAGGITGYASDSTIENCYSEDQVSSGGNFAGGIAGEITGSSKISNCYAICDDMYSGIRVGDMFAGGVTGYISGGTVENSYSTANIRGGRYIGGISGYLCSDSEGNKGKITNCYSTSYISSGSGSSAVFDGGITAYASDDTEISNCVYIGDEIYERNANENLYMNRIAYIAGENVTLNNNYAWEGTKLSYGNDKIIEATDKGTDKADGADIKYSEGKLDKQFSEIFTDGNWTFEENKLPVLNMGTRETSDIPNYIIGYIPSYDEEYKFEGEGTEQSPYIISSLEDLEGLRDNVNWERKTYEGKFFKQTADIDMSELENWYSIGYDSGNDPYFFKGTYDGDNHKISNMSSSSYYSSENTGLFKDLEGTVKNITLENCEVKNNSGTVGMIGILAKAAKNATIINCHVTGGKVSSAGADVGGLIGNIYAYENDTVIKNCSFEGEVDGNSNVGGIVGTSEGADISECYFKGNLSGGSYIGGILGYVPKKSVTLSTSKKTTIKDCYTKAALTGNGSYIGGILGYVQGDAEVTDCYVTGTVENKYGNMAGGIVGSYMGERSLTVKNNVSLLDSINAGGSSAGRILGYNYNDNGLTLKDNYAWEGMRVNGTVVAPPSSGADTIDGESFSYYKGELGKQLSEVFTNKDVWTFEDNKLPVLKNISNAQDNALPSYFDGHLFEGEGTEENPYIISSYANLAKLSDLTNSKGETFSGKFFKQTADIIYYSYYNSWIAIKDFEGTYDGNGKTVTNVLGMFNNLKGTVKNLNMEDMRYSNDVTESTFGVLANRTEGNAKIINCHVKDVNLNVTNGFRIGLIVGLLNGGLIENCSAEGNIEGSSTYVGGIAGEGYGEIKGCTFNGKLNGNSSDVGGIVGNGGENISNCSSSGEFSGYTAGGIAGRLSNGTVENCYSTAKLSGTYVGGILGTSQQLLSLSTVKNCYYLGKDMIIGDYNAGGIVSSRYGNVARVKVENCIAFIENINSSSRSNRIGHYMETKNNNYAWNGTKVKGSVVTDGALNNDNGADVELVDGKVYYNNAEFDWEANGFTEENGWILPSKPYEMPKLKNDTAFPVLTLTQQAQSTIKINETPQVFTYGDENIGFAVKDVEPNTVKDGFKVEYLVSDVWTENVPANAGKYNVKVSHNKVSDDVSGIEKVIESGLVINKAENTVTGLAIDNWKYGEKAKAPKATAKAGEIKFTYSSDGKTFTEEVPTEAGKYTVKAVSEETENYSSAETTAEFEITKADAVLAEAPTAGNVRVGTTLSDCAINGGKVTGVDGKEISGTWTWKDGSEVLSTTGTVSKTAVFTPDNRNYNEIETEAEITVSRKKSEDSSDSNYSGGGSSSSDKKYTIKFETDGGNTIEAEKTNGKITEPEAPEKEGYTFEGWYTDKELTNKFDFDKAVSGNITLYAKWTEKAEENIADKQIILTINEKEATVFGKTVINDVAPVIVNGRTMLPIRFIAESLGATVDWNDTEKKVTIKSEDKEIVIYIGSDTAYVDGAAKELDVEAFIKDSRTYLPLRFISENLGADVQWIAEEKKVVITKK